MGLLSKNDIFEMDDLATKIITVPGWKDSKGNPGQVKIKSLQAFEIDNFNTKQMELSDDKSALFNYKARYISMCIVDDSGKKMFGEIDAQLLGRKSNKALDFIFEECMKLNKQTSEDIKELEKKLPKIEAKDSSTNLQAISEKVSEK